MGDVRRTSRVLIGLLLATVVAAGAGTVLGQDAGEAEDADFVPRAGSPPARRTGGGSRSCVTDPELFISALAPLQVAGLTAGAQPTLYWYISKETELTIETAIIRSEDF